MDKLQEILLMEVYNDPEFRKLYNHYAYSYNKLASKLHKAGINIKYMTNLIKNVEDFNNYKSKI
jgi:hypothetical protein